MGEVALDYLFPIVFAVFGGMGAVAGVRMTRNALRPTGGQLAFRGLSVVAGIALVGVGVFLVIGSLGLLADLIFNLGVIER